MRPRAAQRPAGGSARAAGVAMVAATFAISGVGLASCAGAPWFLGQPLDERSSIPPTSRAQTVADHRRSLEIARAKGEKTIELAELTALEERGALGKANVQRLSELLRERAKDWVALRRPLALVADLRHIIALEPARARPLAVALRNASRAAGDVWLAIGENARAEEEYRRAERLGAPGVLFRLRAAWGASPADLEREVLERALVELPERVLAPFTVAYLDAGGDDPARIRRAWAAARVYGPPELQARCEALPAVLRESRSADIETVSAGVGGATDGRAATFPAPPLKEPGSTEHLYGGATLARALLPLLAAFPNLADPGPRAREWGERLMAEDPTSPDSLEAAALIDARAGRADAAARKLTDLVFYSPDRAEGYVRAARVWERAAEGRRACLAWEKSARLGPADDPRWCRLVTCLRGSPGAGDPVAVRQFVRAHAPTLRCEGEDVEVARPPAADASADAGSIGPDGASGPDGGGARSPADAPGP